MNALKTARHNRFDAQQLRALGRPVAARPRSVFFAREHHGGRPCRHVAYRCVKNGQLFNPAPARAVDGGLKQGHAAFLSRAVVPRRDHEIFDAHIGKGAAHHDIVITAPSTIRIEVGHLHALRQQPLACG